MKLVPATLVKILAVLTYLIWCDRKKFLAYTLLSIHNITELIRFTQKIREAILSDRFVTEFGHWLNSSESAPDEEEITNDK